MGSARFDMLTAAHILCSASVVLLFGNGVTFVTGDCDNYVYGTDCPGSYMSRVDFDSWRSLLMRPVSGENGNVLTDSQGYPLSGITNDFGSCNALQRFPFNPYDPNNGLDSPYSTVNKSYSTKFPESQFFPATTGRPQKIGGTCYRNCNPNSYDIVSSCYESSESPGVASRQFCGQGSLDPETKKRFNLPSTFTQEKIFQKECNTQYIDFSNAKYEVRTLTETTREQLAGTPWESLDPVGKNVYFLKNLFYTASQLQTRDTIWYQPVVIKQSNGDSTDPFACGECPKGTTMDHDAWHDLFDNWMYATAFRKFMTENPEVWSSQRLSGVDVEHPTNTRNFLYTLCNKIMQTKKDFDLKVPVKSNVCNVYTETMIPEFANVCKPTKDAYVCTCNKGTAATGTAGTCQVDGSETCTSCDPGYTLQIVPTPFYLGNPTFYPTSYRTCSDPRATCVPSKCSCTGGVASILASGDSSCDSDTIDTAPDKCSSCWVGFTFNPTKNACKKNVCTCSNGTADDGERQSGEGESPPNRKRKEARDKVGFRRASQVVLASKTGTPCLTACDDPASLSCQTCCRTVTHEIDWGCSSTLAPGSTDTASCCKGDWTATCWNVPSAANHEHACNQCKPVEAPVVSKGEPCAVDGSEQCSKCDAGYTLQPDNACACESGSICRPQTNARAINAGDTIVQLEDVSDISVDDRLAVSDGTNAETVSVTSINVTSARSRRAAGAGAGAVPGAVPGAVGVTPSFVYAYGSNATVTLISPAPSFVWESMRGCCRAKAGGNRFKPAKASTQVFTTAVSIAEATANCSATCAIDKMCTAVQVSKKQKRKPAKCQFHTSTQISSASRASISCKKAECIVKKDYVAPTAAPVGAKPTPTTSPTSAPTTVPQKTLPAWVEKRGCCRERAGKKTFSHHNTATTAALAARSATAAAAACKQQCVDDPTCTAAEFRTTKKTKKKAKAYMCELHTASGMNSSTRASKSCKRATCSILQRRQ